MPEPYLFAADSIGKSFGSQKVLSSASIWATPGRITVLFGRNGCGKSTLLRIGVGLLRADHGAIHYDRRVQLRPRLPELASRGLFYLPDRNLLSRRIPVRRQLRGIEWRFGGGRTAEALDRLDIASVIDQTPDEMSGGERRRAEIAAAWIRNPRCLLADEPFAGINPSEAELLGHSFKQLAREGCAIIVTGHEVPQLFEIADEIVWMVAGTTHGLGSAAQAAQHDQFRREYLGSARLY